MQKFVSLLISILLLTNCAVANNSAQIESEIQLEEIEQLEIFEKTKTNTTKLQPAESLNKNFNEKSFLRNPPVPVVPSKREEANQFNLHLFLFNNEETTLSKLNTKLGKTLDPAKAFVLKIIFPHHYFW